MLWRSGPHIHTQLQDTESQTSTSDVSLTPSIFFNLSSGLICRALLLLCRLVLATAAIGFWLRRRRGSCGKGFGVEEGGVLFGQSMHFEPNERAVDLWSVDESHIYPRLSLAKGSSTQLLLL